jgi:hypothetical protein
MPNKVVRPSDLIWEYLEEQGMNTRAEAQEVFADILLSLLPDQDGGGNGLVIDALEAAIDHLNKKEDVIELLAEEEEIEDEDDE